VSALVLEDVKTHLNITTNGYDAELTAIIAAAEAAIAQRVGPLEVTTVTARVDGSSGVLVLPIWPVISLTSITDSYGMVLTLGSLAYASDTGLVTYANYGGSFTADYYTVVYQAGRTTVPPDLLLAAKELVRHLWESQRSSARLPGTEGPMAVPGAAYLMPYRVKGLLEPHEHAGFA
jgi:hypothetical protein